MLAARAIQARLEVGAANDPYEREADYLADQVMRMALPGSGQAGQRAAPREDELQARPPAARVTPVAQRAWRGPTAEGGFQAGPDFERQLNAARGGAPLPDGTSNFMEPRFGADLSGVRVHTGAQAAQLNRAVSAQAFTHGQDIYLGEGHTDLATGAGQHLLAHELTHVLQQRGQQVGRVPALQAAWLNNGISERWDPAIHGISWHRKRGADGYLYWADYGANFAEAEAYYGDALWDLPNNYATREALGKVVLKQPLVMPPEDIPQPQAPQEQQAPRQKFFGRDEYVYEHDVDYRTRIQQACQDNGLAGLCQAWTLDWIGQKMRGEAGGQRRPEGAFGGLLQEQKRYYEYVEANKEKVKAEVLKHLATERGLASSQVADGEITYGSGLLELDKQQLQPATAYLLEIAGSDGNGHVLSLYQEPTGQITVFDQNFGLLNVANLKRFNAAYTDEIQLSQDNPIIKKKYKYWTLYIISRPQV